MTPIQIREQAARRIAERRDCNDGRMCMDPRCGCRRDAEAAISEFAVAAAAACRRKVRREAGHDGRWEGYGAYDGDMTGPECADAMLALGGLQRR